MDSIVASVLIGVLYVILQYIIHYKECQKPKLKDGLIVFISSAIALSALDKWGDINVKSPVKVFTEFPDV